MNYWCHLKKYKLNEIANRLASSLCRVTFEVSCCVVIGFRCPWHFSFVVKFLSPRFHEQNILLNLAYSVGTAESSCRFYLRFPQLLIAQVGEKSKAAGSCAISCRNCFLETSHAHMHNHYQTIACCYQAGMIDVDPTPGSTIKNKKLNALIKTWCHRDVAS